MEEHDVEGDDEDEGEEEDNEPEDGDSEWEREEDLSSSDEVVDEESSRQYHDNPSVVEEAGRFFQRIRHPTGRLHFAAFLPGKTMLRIIGACAERVYSEVYNHPQQT